MGEHRLNVFSTLRRRIGARKLCNVKHHNCILVIKYYVGDQMMEDELHGMQH
jgi:hypothetical protein